jgi:hypothetical protein
MQKLSGESVDYRKKGTSEERFRDLKKSSGSREKVGNGLEGTVPPWFQFLWEERGGGLGEAVRNLKKARLVELLK